MGKNGIDEKNEIVSGASIFSRGAMGPIPGFPPGAGRGGRVARAPASGRGPRSSGPSDWPGSGGCGAGARRRRPF